jgi:Tfp pilus assembly protein PilF
MRNRWGWQQWLLIALVALVAGAFTACADRHPAVTETDTPERHVASGMRFFEQGHLDEAQGEFAQALGMDPQYGPAYVGQGLVLGVKASLSREPKERAKITTNAFSSLKDGKKYAADTGQKVQAYVAYIRLHAMIKDKDWLADAEENFEYATALDRRPVSPYFFMGEAYKQAYRYNEAAGMYRKVLDLGRNYTDEARRALELMERIQRASPATEVGKQIALVNAITRAEAAALFVHEFNLSEMYAGAGSPGSDEAEGDSRSGPRTESMVKKPQGAATDLATHPLRLDVETVLSVGVRGLELYPDHTFRPNELVTRAEFALMVEGILIRVSGDGNLTTRFAGKSSPFLDLGNDSPYFNAVMVCTGTGIMEPAGPGSREFHPGASVSGADALVAIRNLTEYLARTKGGRGPAEGLSRPPAPAEGGSRSGRERSHGLEDGLAAGS